MPYLFIYCLFILRKIKGALNNSDLVASKDCMVNEHWTSKHVEKG
jgi:hypothetical protein